MSSGAIKRNISVYIGSAATNIGTLVYTKHGQREYSSFSYAQSWLAEPKRFSISPDLELIADYQVHKVYSEHKSVFHGAIADTEPDAWGCRVIAREHAKRRAVDKSLTALTAVDYLMAVDDYSRTGALRLKKENSEFSETIENGINTTPPIIELDKVYAASLAVEKGEESASDLKYLLGKGTSLGGMRPKCTVIDENGQLAIGKFPSINDIRSVTRGEVLALHLAKQAGIDVAAARIVEVLGVPIAVISRFDRSSANDRIPYLSASSFIQATGADQDYSYTEIADAIRVSGYSPNKDIQQLWRRMLFNLLITNVDDHLKNHAFLHVEKGLWRLAPAFDLNPFPDKTQESKTWLSEQDGPITSVSQLIGRAKYFALDKNQALDILKEVTAAVVNWRIVAQGPEVGITKKELKDFASAFEHTELEQAKKYVE